MGVEEGQKYGSTVGNGLLAPGGEHVETLGVLLQSRVGQATFVLMSRDLDNNLYLWAADGRSKRYRARKVRRRKVPTKFGDLFHVMYADTPLP